VKRGEFYLSSDLIQYFDLSQWVKLIHNLTAEKRSVFPKKAAISPLTVATVDPNP